MAWYSVECPVCGETYRVNLVGKHSSREWKLETWDWTCDACREKARQEVNSKAAAKNAEAGLPSLSGSEKQVAWAETVRERMISAMDAELKRENPFDFDQEHPDALILVEATARNIREQTKASWWLDHRDDRLPYLFQTIAQGLYETGEWKKTEEDNEDERKAETEAKAEATIRPETPVTETVAEIRPEGKKVCVIFPEKREELRLLMRRHGFHWANRQWERSITAFSGSAEDRAVEIGNLILAEGIPIRLFDEELRERILSAEYDPEQRRWITQRIKGRYTGYFSISWPRDEDFYDAARGIISSKYDGEIRSVVVPPEHYDEVLDFAERYEFAVSDGAKELVAEAEKLKEKAMIATPKKHKRREAPAADGKPPKLEVPEEVDIDESLRDNE